MATKHKVIGLVSGGKDSCFNLCHVVANGHDVVALATLTPEPGVDELDSHLFQSVGTAVPPLIARSMGVPHFSRVIRGTAVEVGAEYGRRVGMQGVDGDETEDLTALLCDVLAAHPDATALASGAILSTYQRLRIEHVCARLGLVSLAFLWQAEQMPLVDRMIGAGLEAVLVKVAGVGLGARQVGKTLAQVRPLLGALEQRYGSHPAGEGGEYETLTLDGPLFSHRVVLEDTAVVVSDPEPHEVAYLRIGGARLELKEGWVRPDMRKLRRVLGLTDEGAEGGGESGGNEEAWRVRHALDDEGREVLDQLQGLPVGPALTGTDSVVVTDEAAGGPSVRFGRQGRWFAVSVEGITDGDESIGDELARCFDEAETKLAAASLSLTQVAHITLLLSSMSLFAPANAAYTRRFGVSPPSRATVAVLLPPGQRVRLELTGHDEAALARSAHGRQALHVQGQSYWAPANIGPYSQAVTADNKVHFAGQIPLVPSSLALPPHSPTADPYPLQSALALQHVRRVVRALQSVHASGGGWTGWAEGAVVWYAAGQGAGLAVVRKAWHIWTRQFGNGFKHAPVVFVRAKELPRNALVEVQVFMDTGRACAGDDDDDVDERTPTYTSAQGVERCASGSRPSRAIFFVEDGQVDDAAQLDLSGAVGVRVYHVTSCSIMSRILVTGVCVTPIPVHAVAGRDGREYAAALEVFYG
ncbi:hypothetical protein Q5752_001151 [Cryptotrichosporon argae]